MRALDHLITSRVRAKTLRHFYTHHEPQGARAIARYINEDIKNVHHSLQRLVASGLIKKVGTEYQPANVELMKVLEIIDKEII